MRKGRFEWGEDFLDHYKNHADMWECVNENCGTELDLGGLKKDWIENSNMVVGVREDLERTDYEF